jgi:hypothetical protein
MFLYFTVSRLLPKGCHLDMVGGPSTPHDPESDARRELKLLAEPPKPVRSRRREEGLDTYCAGTAL